jgi:hypothetical protein
MNDVLVSDDDTLVGDLLVLGERDGESLGVPLNDVLASSNEVPTKEFLDDMHLGDIVPSDVKDVVLLSKPESESVKDVLDFEDRVPQLLSERVAEIVREVESWGSVNEFPSFNPSLTAVLSCWWASLD